jgi:hypothetical protein
MTQHADTRDQETDKPEDKREEPGVEGGSQSSAKDKLPGASSDDDSAVGDTDQHSSG